MNVIKNIVYSNLARSQANVHHHRHNMPKTSVCGTLAGRLAGLKSILEFPAGGDLREMQRKFRE